MASLRANYQYAKYVARHKLFVFLAGRQLGVGLWNLIVHDFSKFSRAEWGPYVDSFYGPKYLSIKEIHGDARNHALDTGHYKEAVRERFDAAWNHHQKVNPHHWQWHFLVNDQDGTYPLAMPDRYRREMLADWIAMGQAKGKPDTRRWYLTNREKMQLHPETREWVERQLGVLRNEGESGAPY